MSVLINMEMPTSCGECRFAVDGWCYACEPESREERMRITTNYCHLVPVPPHGRLIDADALIDWIYSDEPNAWKAPFRLCTADRSDVKFLLKQAPTIIPAEEGET